MKFVATDFDGLFVIEANKLGDARGAFVKTFHDGLFKDAGIDFAIKEVYYSTSQKNVLRGLHFQTPPHDHGKLVYCLQGAVLDVAVDLRKSSKTYGQHFKIELNAEAPKGVFVPSGFAHGFLALTDNLIFMNATSSVYAGGADAGIAWDGCNIDWPIAEPVLSDKDKAMPSLADYETPFA